MDYQSAIPQPVPTSEPIVVKLRRSWDRGQVLLGKPKLPRGDIQLWFNQLRSRLQDLYGASSPLVKQYRDKAKAHIKESITHDEYAYELSLLKGLVDYLEYSAGCGTICPTSTPSTPPQGCNVFVIHGHDELNTRRLTHLLQNEFRLTPIAMMSRPGMSRPLIDKYEESASHCTFAFALVTPDDVVASPTGEHRQARPNVIFELGWFVGRLGKHRVTILLKEGTMIHSDIDGVSRIHFKDNIEEKYLEIQRELSAAGLI